MTDLKRSTPKKLLWLDLEMTGLDPLKDRVVEVGVIVTDWDFTELESFESGVGQDRDEIEARVKGVPFFEARPAETRELLDLSLGSPPEAEIEQKVVDLVNRHFGPDEPALLAGNSIHQDRRFIRQWWPKLEARLHYRMLDVSAWKVVMSGKYGIEFEKAEAHRALGDIRESIAELQSYLQMCNIR